MASAQVLPIPFAAVFLVVAVVATGCTRTSPPAARTPPSSCITHDPTTGTIEQCFDYVGPQSRKFGRETCRELEGKPTYQDGQPCPTANRHGSCARRVGTDFESVERCYANAESCERRCLADKDVFTPN